MSGFAVFLMVFFAILSVWFIKWLRDEKRANRFRRQQALVAQLRQERE
jgi:predicted ABC-type exoprotein transport system permease subunit